MILEVSDEREERFLEIVDQDGKPIDRSDLEITTGDSIGNDADTDETEDDTETDTE